MKNEANFIEYQLDIEDINFTFFAVNIAQINHKIDKDKPDFHSHQHNELFYVIDGSIELNTENETFKLEKDDLAIIPANMYHFISKSEKSYCINIGFTLKQNKNKKFSNTFSEQFITLSQSKEIKLLRSFDKYDSFKRFLIYHNNSFSDNTNLIKACLYELMFLLKDRFFEKNTIENIYTNMNTLSYRDYTIDQYISSKYNTYNSLDELAEIVHLSKQQLQRIIKKLYNQTYSERILSLKLINSKKLLKSTNKSVTEISSIVGYSSPHGFFNSFKKAFGITPNEYRNLKNN